ncbi:hypothetical protein LCGC14_0345920 [marine sediment metagenome]|uniref:Methyltransferase type 11 domain-containing protein n=1 Tax=marine sediment metagenome TaxID=412755 RepID=A0A0F9TC64_9ZZZZ
MIPVERENNGYRTGKRCLISKAEEALFNFLGESVSSILDIGCGSGEIMKRLQDDGHELTGLDFSPVAIGLAKQKGLNCKVHDLDTGIPYPDGAFNVVWAGDIIEHVFDPIFLMKEIKRVLVKGGQLLCSVPYDLNLVNRLRILFGYSYQEFIYRRYGQCKHHTFISLGLIKYMLNKAGFVIKEIRYVVKFPKIGKEFITKSRSLNCFAYTMMISAEC